MTRRSALLLGGSLALAGCEVLWAQPDEGAGAQAPVAGAAEVAPDVFIKDSFAAQELIDKAQRLADRGQYREAGLLLDQVLRDHADKLIAVRPGSFEAIPQHVHRLLGGWPAEGLTAYRGAVEHVARARFEGLSSSSHGERIEELLALLERYYCTTTGARIGIRAAELAVEAGDLALAARLYDQLRTTHPDRKSQRCELSARLALVYALWGKPQQAAKCLAEAGPDVVVRWMGEPRPIGTLLPTLRPVTDLSERRASSAAWPVFGGNNQRNAVAPAMVDQVTLLWQFEAFDSDEHGVNPGGRRDPAARAERSIIQQRAMDQGRLLGMLPVVGDGLIFVQDAATVWAIHSASGKLAWSRSARPGDEGRRSGNSDPTLAPWHAPTLAGQRVYACMGGDEQAYFGGGPPADAVALLCLDASTGEELWRVERDKLGPALDRGAAEPDAKGAFNEELYFDSSPLVSGGLALSVVRRRRSFGFEDAYVYAFDADTGRVVWQTHIGSASAGGFGYRRSTLAIPALQEDTLYVNSNLGGVAAIWTATGRVRWLRLYPRQSEAQWRSSGRGSSREIVPWEYNPIICAGSHIVVAPLDAAAVLVFDRDSGEPAGEIPLEALGNVQTLLGVVDQRLYGLGDGAFCWDLGAGSMVWASPIPAGPAIGRGLLTSDALLVPTRTALVTFDRAAGTPKSQPWAPGALGNSGAASGGGNLLTTPEQLIVAGYEKLSAYARKEDVWGRLRERMAQAPADPAPALDLAEIAMRSGDPQEALAGLSAAAERAGGFVEPLDPELKRRIFEDCVAFAELLAGRLAARSAPPADAEPGAPSDPRLPSGDDIGREAQRAMLDKLLEFAAQCPPDSRGHLRYRLRFAEIYERLNRADSAVRLYQQILSDASLRELPVVSARPGGRERAEPLPLAIEPERREHTVPAGTLADARIGELIERFGRSIYAVFDAEAAARLVTLKAAGDAAGLEQLANAYPRASAAPAALLARGQILRQHDDPLGAARVLAASLARYRAQVDAPDVLRQIAEAYLAAGRTEDAWAWLSKAAREYPSARITPASPQGGDGSAITFAEYRDRLGDVRGRVEPAMPRLTLPLEHHEQRSFDNAFTLLEPLFDSAPESSWRDYYIFSDDSLQAYVAASGAPVWGSALPCRTPPTLLLVTASGGEPEKREREGTDRPTGGRVVLSTRFQLIALDAATGASVWTLGEMPADAAGPLADHENFSLFQSFGYAGGKLVAARSDGLIACVDVATGHPVWQQKLDARAGLPIAMNYSWVVYPCNMPGGGGGGLCVLDAETGGLVRLIDTDDERQIERLFLTLSGQIVAVTVQTIVAFDPRSGQKLWSYAADALPAAGGAALVPSTAEPDLDGLYFYVGAAGRREFAGSIRKIGFDDGRVLWTSEPLVARPEEGITTALVAAQLLVAGGRFVTALDAIDGRTLWEGTVDKESIYRRRFVTERYLIALHEPPERRPGTITAYFYDYRQRSGAIPAKIGVINLGELTEVQLITVRDDALLVQSGKTLHAWTHTP